MRRRYLTTSEIARAVGVHPNTVRLYEIWGFLPPIPRSPAGYRQFSEEHLDLMRLAHRALRHPYPGGKQPVLDLVRRAVVGDLDGALECARTYLAQVIAERGHAEAAAELLSRWAQGPLRPGTRQSVAAEPLRIGEVARLLAVTADALRNWERNGLIDVPHDPGNRYRLYGSTEIDRLRVIRVLRAAGYSTMAILRMLRHLDRGEGGDLRQVLDTPRPDEDACYCTDRWLSTLAEQERRARDVIAQLAEMIGKRQQPSTCPPRLDNEWCS